MTLADEDTNSILANDAKRAIQRGNASDAGYASGAILWPNLLLLLMQVAPSGGKICNSCKFRHLVAKFATNVSGAIWLPNLQLMQVAPSGDQISN